MRKFFSFFEFSGFLLFLSRQISCFSVDQNVAFEYKIDSFFGSPIQPVYLYVDLNAADIWLLSSECSTCSHFGFNPSSSSTFKNQTTSKTLQFSSPLNDQESTLGGYVAQDLTLLVPEVHSDDKIQSQKFTLITSLSGADPSVSPYGVQYDGRVGLGLTSKNAEQSVLDLFFDGYDRLYCVGNVGPSTWTQIGREALQQNVEYTNLTSTFARAPNDETGWQFVVDGYSFGKFSTSTPLSTMLSTTTSFIYVPSSFIDLITRQLHASRGSAGELIVDCDQRKTAPTFQIEIMDVNLEVPATRYIQEISKDKCVAQFRAHPNATDRLVLGVPFLDSVALCLDFDTQIVSFLNAKLKYQPIE